MRRKAFPRRALALLALCACEGSVPDNVLLVSFDTTRPDHLSVYGAESPTSPNLEALAARGTLFERAYSHVPSTTSAHASMLTGLTPPSHGVRLGRKLRLAAAATTLPEMLRERGFTTAAIVAGPTLNHSFALDQGFDHYDDDFGGEAMRTLSFADTERRAHDVTDRALAWLAGREPRWLLFVHYFDPHTPYLAPREWLERLGAPYDAEIAWADHQLGRLLEAVARAAGRTLVVFTGDHGEGLGEHGESFHGRLVHDATIRVPLIFAFEGVVRAGARSRLPAAHADLLPTILDLLGEPVPAGLDGRSLVPALTGEGDLESVPLYAEANDRGRRVRSLRTENWKLVERQLTERIVTRELYDLESDPRELRDRARDEQERTERMHRELVAQGAAYERDGFASEPVALGRDLVQRLRALGYLRDEQGAPTDAPRPAE